MFTNSEARPPESRRRPPEPPRNLFENAFPAAAVTVMSAAAADDAIRARIAAVLHAGAVHARLPFADVGADGGAALAEALRGARALKSLDVSCGGVTPGAAAALAGALADHEAVRCAEGEGGGCDDVRRSWRRWT